MLPVPLLSKLGNYEVEVHDGRLIREKISELRGFLKSQVPVMGLDFKPGSSYAQMVLVCAGCRCLIFKIGADLGDLAAKVLKKLNLARWGLAELASEVGGRCVVPDWNATVFSDEQIKYAIHDVYASYLIGKKLLGML
ncbi:hypothetical protein D8674_023803 [Pyrus ussuriensis x Pyrus communis]|uniref:Uncharacterized protein n=1 Tax=Pyrus ussuriensis x Pyrus communis TaxID=2448454 RepID=A0A5N5H609_9ROSA|nr:hypothetical protein D8674_023803 [Pyrus ussuriensis x Pyrus communis]